MTDARTVQIGELALSNRLPLVLIAGPCQLEGLDHALGIADALAAACAEAGAGLIFKSSYDKANRTSLGAQRGLGMDEGLAILAAVRDRVGCPVLTDVHLPDRLRSGGRGRSTSCRSRPSCRARPTSCSPPAPPAPRSTSRRASSSRPGTWRTSPPRSPRPATSASCSASAALRFGYNTLVADMRALPIMARTGYPGGDGRHPFGAAAGRPGRPPRAASASSPRSWPAPRWRSASPPSSSRPTPTPTDAPSDGPNMIELDRMPALIAELMAFDRLAKAAPARPDPPFRLVVPAPPPIEPTSLGAWPSGKATVFGTVYRRFESSRPSQLPDRTRSPFGRRPKILVVFEGCSRGAVHLEAGTGPEIRSLPARLLRTCSLWHFGEQL